MKTQITIPALALCLGLAASGAQATTDASNKEKWNGAAKFTGGALVGGLVGGPVGMVVGALGGGLFADQEARTAASEENLAHTQRDLKQLEQEIAQQETKIVRLEEETMARLELKVFFDTGVDQVTELDRQRLKAMADYLSQNPALEVELSGHADPRGTDEYNNVLSRERAEAIKQALIEEGIPEERVRTTYHGSDLSTAATGDLEAYARERRVDIDLTPRAREEVTQTW